MDLSTAYSKVVSNVSKNSPAILTGFAVAGLVGTVVLAVKATPTALDLINAEKLDRIDAGVEDESLSVVDTVKVAYKPYIPAAALGIASVACIIGANHVSSRRTAVLASAYSLTDATLKEYQNKVKEVVGEKKVTEIKDSIAQDRLDKNPVSEKTVVMTGRGETLMFESLSGRYFKSDIETVRRIQNDINQQLLGEMWVSLNELYDALGLEHTRLGDEMGWEPDNMLEFDFRSKLATDGTPCLVIDYVVDPKIERRYNS